MIAVRGSSVKEHKVEVFLDKRFIGTLAETSARRVAFANSNEWLEFGFAINPFPLPEAVFL